MFLSEQMGRRQLALSLGALMLSVFLAALDSSIVANALPRVVADLHGIARSASAAGLWAWGDEGACHQAAFELGGRVTSFFPADGSAR